MTRGLSLGLVLRPRFVALPFAAAGMLAIGACGAGQDDAASNDATTPTSRASGTSAAPVAPTASIGPTSVPTREPAADGTLVRIMFGDSVLTGRLRDNPTAQDLVSLLPIRLTFRDFNDVEKISKLPRGLTIDGVPEGDDPEIGDIGYYAPSGDLVLYYGDVGYWPGIVRLGQLDGGWDSIARQTGDFEGIIELVD